MNSVKLNNLSFKYLRFTQSGCKGIGIRKFDFMAKNQFLFTIRFALFLNKMIKSTEKITTYFQVFLRLEKENTIFK